MQRFIDSILASSASGMRPIGNASVTIYRGGTTAPATIYSDNGVTQKQNPFFSNPEGGIDFYAADGRYDIRISHPSYPTSWVRDIILADFIDDGFLRESQVSTVAFTGEYDDLKDKPEISKEAIGLSNVDNTSDEDKPVSIAQAEAIKDVRDDLAEPDGSGLVGFKQSGDGALDRTAAEKFSEILSINDYATTERAISAAINLNSIVRASSNITIRIPSDAPTLQTAIDRVGADQRFVVTLLIESGHHPNSGIFVQDGDYGNFKVSSEDAEVVLGEEFSGDFISGNYARTPVLNCLIDANKKATRGYRILSSEGLVSQGCGVKNVLEEGLWAYHSKFNGDQGVWSGAGTYAIRVSRGTIFNASGSDCRNCTGGQNGIVYVNRGSIGNIQFSDFSGSQAQKILYSHRASKLNAHNIIADGCVIDSPDSAFSGFAVAGRGSELDINESSVINLNGKFISAFQGGTVVATSMVDTINDVGNGQYNFIENRSGTVIFSGTSSGFRDGLNQVGGSSELKGSINNPSRNGITSTDVAVIYANTVNINDAGVNGVSARYGAKVSVRGGSIKGSGTRDLQILDGGEIFATNCETTNGSGGPDVSDTNLQVSVGFNAIDGGKGIIWA